MQWYDCSMVRHRNINDIPESSEQGAAGEPSLAQALAALLESRAQDSEMLRQLVQNTARTGGRGGNNDNHQPRQCSYSDFLSTHPPTFERAKEPLDADHWLRVMESKFGLLECSDQQKAAFAAQQLLGSASAWWANYEASLPAGQRVVCTQFKEAFRAHFIPAALM